MKSTKPNGVEVYKSGKERCLCGWRVDGGVRVVDVKKP
jgi:hypothetical protein